MNPYAKRKINITIRLAEGEFSEKEGPEVTLEGLRVSCGLLTYYGDAQGALQLRVYGLRLDRINQLTRIGPINNQTRNNSIIVSAGDEGGAMATIFIGTIDKAFGELSPPEGVLNIIALSAGFPAVEKVQASSYEGSVDAAVVMGDFAKAMGLSYENNGVSCMLSNPYFPGTRLEQVRECARSANIYYTIERGKLAIWPKKGFRAGEPIKVGPQAGMVGYPQFSAKDLILTTLFNPDVSIGMRVDVTSELTVAAGVWNVSSVAHALESETPNGQWFTQISCYRDIDAK